METIFAERINENFQLRRGFQIKQGQKILIVEDVITTGKSSLECSNLGSKVNIGAGTITANYDGDEKHQTVIGDESFIGVNSVLIAPVNVGAKSRTGAGTVVTKDVPPDSLVVGIPGRIRPGKGE